MENNDESLYEKLKRNVVIFSFAIVIASFLELSELDLLGRWFSLPENLPKFTQRVVLIELIVLAYFYLRFRFSKQYMFEAKELESQFKACLYLAEKHQVQWLLNNYGRTLVQSKSILTDMSQWWLEGGFNPKQRSQIYNKLAFDILNIEQKNSRCEGYASISVEATKNGELVYASTGGNRVCYKLSRCNRLSVLLRALFRTIRTSRSMVEWVLPNLIAILAVILLARSFFAPFFLASQGVNHLP